MTGRYPNIMLLDYRFQEEILRRIPSTDRYIPDVDTYMFPQVWPNTGGGFAEPGGVYGQAFIKEYTTVLVSHNHNMAMVAFGDKPAYIVDDLTEKFMSDLRTHSMASVHESRVYD